MFVELCTYHCLPNRMPALLARFENATLALFGKHGFKPLGFFISELGPNRPELKYLLEWQSMDQRMAAWAAFRADPDWERARLDSEADGQLVDVMSNEILTPTSFSPIR